MDDPEVQKTVETVLGTKNVDIIDCEKKSSMKEEEYLLINGKRVNLEDGDGRAIRQALVTGQVPTCDLLNTLLIKTGILKAPVRLETQLSVKTSTITKEEVTVARDGKIVDERSREVKENNVYTTSSSEVWEPVKIIPTSDLPKYKIGENLNLKNENIPKNMENGGQNQAIPLWNSSRASPIPKNMENGGQNQAIPLWNSSRASPIPKNLTQPQRSRDNSPIGGKVHFNQPPNTFGPSRTHINGQNSQFYVPQDLKLSQNQPAPHPVNGNQSQTYQNFGNPQYCPQGRQFDLRGDHRTPPNNHMKYSEGFGPAPHPNGHRNDPRLSNNQMPYGVNSPKNGEYPIQNGSNGQNGLGNGSNMESGSSNGPNWDHRQTESYQKTANSDYQRNPNIENGKNGYWDSQRVQPQSHGKPIDPNFSRDHAYWESIRSKCSDSSQNGYETSSEKFGSLSSASSNESEIIGLNRFPSKDSGHLTCNSSSGHPQSSGESLNSLDEVDFKNDLIHSFRKCGLRTNGYKKDISDPTIFGTVASDLIPKDCSNRRSLPQTPQTSKNFSSLYNRDSLSTADSIAEAQLHHDNALVYRDGNLISGPLEALIQHTVPTETYYPDRAYLFAFLLSCRLFVKPHELLARIKSLGDQQQANTRTYSVRFAEYMAQLVTEWTETFPYDYRDERMMQIVRQITQQCLSVNPSLHSNVQTLLQNLHQRLTALEIYEKSTDNFSEDQISSDIIETCPNASLLAQQLTHVELERLSFIGPEEFVQAFAKENPNIETSYKDMKKTKNLEQYVQWFNRLSYFVATQVCKHPKKKQRVRVVEYWIETARECFNIGNFNSLMAIIAGLNMSPISRLKKTWNKIQSGKFSILEHQMDPSSNFSSYRSTLKAAMWRSAGATDQRQRIVIPFFSLLVKDLYFLNEGCSNRLPNGHINFEKFWQLAKQVTEFMAWKQVTCPFEKDSKVISVLQKSPILGENALALASFECEPPENNQERERCKTLKAESNNT